MGRVGVGERGEIEWVWGRVSVGESEWGER